MQLIQQKEALSYRLSEDLDVKSDNMRALRGNLEDEAALLRETIGVLEGNVADLRQQLAAREGEVRRLQRAAELTSKRHMSDTINEEARQQVAELEEKQQNLRNQLNIIQDDLEESQHAREDL